MEQALFLNRLCGPLPSGYDRLYFGSEFCPWTFPGAGDILQAISEARGRGMRFTLSTPVITENFLSRLRQVLVEVLPHLDEGDEVMLSDWGAVPLLRELAPELTLVLGRALSGQKRGPRILDLSLSEAQKDYFRQGSWYALEATALLAEQRVARVELDNLLQGVGPLPGSLRGSLHYPFAMVSSSRNCPFCGGGTSVGCSARCGEAFRLESPQSRQALWQAGNTQFLKNDQLPSDPAGLGIDRLVHHPRIPR